MDKISLKRIVREKGWLWVIRYAFSMQSALLQALAGIAGFSVSFFLLLGNLGEGVYKLAWMSVILMGLGVIAYLLKPKDRMVAEK